MTNFIYEGHINHALCDKIIEYHKNNPQKYEGVTLNNYGMFNKLNKHEKDSTDVLLLDENLYEEYCKEIKKIVNTYITIYPSCNFYSPFGINEGVIIQHYLPNGGYKVWHTERGSANNQTSNRHLVFMTYLNDVTDGGGTEFLNQSLTVQAKKGRTLIWPADWTHTHRGVVSPSQEKYIITGWLNFLDTQNAQV
jgi:hypothetical protein